ncbi:Thioredoxin [Macleaya cordata]|uniref:Thioredoxin n=1 Tax=Macleaya cordata TaxID=56857 RepID=A0A200Q5C0_MACCD|nr:Thioredoxin [Macleaya cordata]
MAVNYYSVQRSSSLRALFRNNKLFFASSNPCFQDFSIKTLTTNPPQISSLFPLPPHTLLPSQLKPFSSFATLNLPHFSSLFFSPSRSLCSSSSKSSSNFVVIKSEEEFNSSLNRVHDDSLPAIFYFTAAWCGPCKLMSPIIEELSKKYPHVTTYKIDVDQYLNL